jgi:hypothetical protein
MLWLLAAAAIAALAVFGRRAIPGRRELAAMAAGGLAGASPLVWYEIASWLATLRYIRSARQPLSWDLFASRWRGAAEVMVADREQRIVWGGPATAPWQLALGAALLGLTLLAVFVRPSPDRARGLAPWRRAFALTALLLMAILDVRPERQPAPHRGDSPAGGRGARHSRRRARDASAPRAGPRARGGRLAGARRELNVRIERGLRETGGSARSRARWTTPRILRAPHRTRPPQDPQLGNPEHLCVASGGSVTAPSSSGARRASAAGPTVGRRGERRRRLSSRSRWDRRRSATGRSGSSRRSRAGGPRTETVFPERSGVPCVRLIEIGRSQGAPTPGLSRVGAAARP